MMRTITSFVVNRRGMSYRWIAGTGKLLVFHDMHLSNGEWITRGRARRCTRERGASFRFFVAYCY
jgi:hypothetical protein